jgi:cytochrome b6-f complex iron-sulfur subunit
MVFTVHARVVSHDIDFESEDSLLETESAMMPVGPKGRAAAAALGLAGAMSGAYAFQAPGVARPQSSGQMMSHTPHKRAHAAMMAAEEGQEWLAEFGAHITADVPGAVPAANRALGIHPTGEAQLAGPFEFTYCNGGNGCSQQKLDVWQVGTLDNYPWLAEQLGIKLGGSPEEVNDMFCDMFPNLCSVVEGDTVIPQMRTRSGVTMMADTDGFVPDMQRRTVMNLVLLGGAGVPVVWLAGGFVYFFVPPSGGGGGGGLTALDAAGDAVNAAAWAQANPFPGRSLVQGLKGDAHYLIVKQDGTLEDYAINAVCTHLGCVVPWNRAANKYMCPCHGSQYDPTGKVVRGPAPLSLALAHVEPPEKNDGKVVLTPWTETDFRTDTPPWWK